MTARRDHILGTVGDLVADFLYYDRKEDEGLPAGQIEEAIAAAEIVTAFAQHLRDGLQ